MGAALALRVSGIFVSETAMSDRIEEIVERTIAHTRRLLQASPDRWDAARRGLETICGDLAKAAPHNPALARLRAFVGEEDAARRGS
jgi:hypothetical protein